MFKASRRRILAATSTAIIASTVFIPQAAAGDYDTLKSAPGIGSLLSTFEMLYSLSAGPLTLSSNLGIFDFINGILAAIPS